MSRRSKRTTTSKQSINSKQPNDHEKKKSSKSETKIKKHKSKTMNKITTSKNKKSVKENQKVNSFTYNYANIMSHFMNLLTFVNNHAKYTGNQTNEK